MTDLSEHCLCDKCSGEDCKGGEEETRPDDYPLTPNVDKACKVQDTTQQIGEFIAWLKESKHIYLAQDVTRMEEPQWGGKPYEVCETRPIRTPIQRLLAEFNGIDYDGINREQAAVLRYIQEKAKKPTPTSKA